MSDKVSTEIGLLDSMVRFGEDHSPISREVVKKGREDLTRLRAEKAELVEVLEELQSSAVPITSECFYDNGDVTIGTRAFLCSEIERVFWAERKARALLKRMESDDG